MKGKAFRHIMQYPHQFRIAFLLLIAISMMNLAVLDNIRMVTDAALS